MVVATESAGSASRYGLGRTTDLIRIIPAIVLSVADPRRQDAISGRVAGNEIEHRRDIGLKRAIPMRRHHIRRVARQRRTTYLVRGVRAVPSSITLIRLLDAHALLTPEFPGHAGAIGLVRVIAAVVLAIAQFALRNASLGLEA